MRSRTKQTFKVTALAAALFSAYGFAFADGPESSASVGIGSWSNDRPQRGIFDGMRENGSYLLLDADILKRDDATGTWLGLKLRNLGLDNREIKGEWQRQGDIGASVEYSRIPRANPYTFNTGVTGIGGTVQRVPIATIVPGTGSNVELGTVRDRTTFKFFKNLAGGLNFNVSFRNEEKEGTRQWGRGGGAEFAVEPIASTTRQLEAILTYSRDKLQMSGGYYGTWYTNGHTYVDTRNSNLTNPYFLSLPMDAKGHEGFVNGGYNFTPTMRGTFKASYSRVTQDEHLPTADLGVANAAAPTHLGGRLDTTLLEAGLTAKPLQDLSVVANLRYRDFEDKTPIQKYVVAGAGAPVYNTPFSYTNIIGKLEGTYRLPQSYSLLGGIEYNNQDRSVPLAGTTWVPFRVRLDEMTYRIQLRKSMSETVNGSLAFAHSERYGGGYKLTGQGANPGQDLINPLNISDRNRDKLRAMLDWSPMDRLSLQFVVEDSTDKYGNNGLPYGLLSGKAQLYTADANYQLNPDWAINAWVSRDENKAREVTQRDTVTTKYNNLGETGTSFGLGLRGTVSGKLKVGGDVERFRSVNKYNQGVVGATAYAAGTVAGSPPDITNKLLRIKLFAQYAVQKNADLRFSLTYEKWQTDDWSWMMFPAGGGTVPFTYSLATDGTTVTQNAKQVSTFISARYIYRFE